MGVSCSSRFSLQAVLDLITVSGVPNFVNLSNQTNSRLTEIANRKSFHDTRGLYSYQEIKLDSKRTIR